MSNVFIWNGTYPLIFIGTVYNIRKTRMCCGFDGLYSSMYLQFHHSLSHVLEWYHRHFNVPWFFQLFSKIQVFRHFLVFLYCNLPKQKVGYQIRSFFLKLNSSMVIYFKGRGSYLFWLQDSCNILRVFFLDSLTWFNIKLSNHWNQICDRWNNVRNEGGKEKRMSERETDKKQIEKV